jgi:hypothetical protein
VGGCGAARAADLHGGALIGGRWAFSGRWLHTIAAPMALTAVLIRDAAAWEAGQGRPECEGAFAACAQIEKVKAISSVEAACAAPGAAAAAEQLPLLPVRSDEASLHALHPTLHCARRAHASEC